MQKAEVNRVKGEIAHTLYMDVVDSTRYLFEREKRLREELKTLVAATPEYQAALATGNLLCRAVGDGLALVFFGDPVAPIQCAIEIARGLSERADLRLRMGINTGLVSRLRDINEKEDVVGPGIDVAQRVMDCGEAGHILLSEESAKYLRHYDEWKSYLYDLGEYEAKHGLRLNLVAFADGEVGRREPPQARLRESAAMVKAPETEIASGRAVVGWVKEDRQSSPSSGEKRVVLLYKRHAQPDEYVLKLLETELTAQGFAVFVDQRRTIGVAWVQEIEAQVWSADAVIPLISEAAVRSEMLEYELTTAHQAAQATPGKPRILPVRINYTGAITASFAAILDSLHHALWQSPEDDALLVRDILKALQEPPAALPSQEMEGLEPYGGAVPLDSKYWIVRPVEATFRASIARQDSIVLVKGARQMGKTSLLARGLQQAREQGARVVLTDLQMLNDVHLQSADTLYLALAAEIARQLGLEAPPRAIWDSELGPNPNMEDFLRREVLNRLDSPLVWGMDEVDRLFTCAFGSEVFGLFRSWHNRRALDPTGPWGKLTLVIAYATEAHLFIADPNQSPFNVGTRLTLEDFSQEQVWELNRRYGRPLRNDEEIARCYHLLSGHPFLTRRGLDEMVACSLDFAALEAQADREEGIFSDHLRRLLVLLLKDQELTEVVRNILRGGSCATPESFYRLRSAGCISGDSEQEVRMRCQLYATYLTRHLLNK